MISIFKKLVVAAIATTSLLQLASCAQQNEFDADSNKGKGESTYASFSFKIDNPATRAEDGNADAVETTVSSVKLYIFSDNVLETAIVPTLNRTETEPVETTTGRKMIYVVTPAETLFENGFTPSVGTTTLSQFEQALTKASASVIAKENTFLMAGGRDYVVARCTKEEAKARPVSITLTRSSAKMQLKIAEDTEIRESIGAAFSEFYFGIAQASRNMYLIGADDHYTSLGTKTAGSGTYSNFETLPSDYTGFYVPAVNEFNSKASDSRYCGENYQKEEPMSGSTTFALIKSKVTPAEVYGGSALTEGTFWVIALNDSKTASWIFLQNEGRQLYFASKADAENYISTNKVNEGIEEGAQKWAAYEYKEGICYYRLNITTDQEESHAKNLRFRVMRNTFYQATVTKIDALGSPTPGGVIPDDPDQPVEPSAWLVCKISLKPWTVCNMGDQVLQ